MARTFPRPAFIEALAHAYNHRGKSAILLTGNTHDVFWSPPLDTFLTLERTLFQAWCERFIFIRFDAAMGISFFDNAHRQALLQLCAAFDRTAAPAERLGDIQAYIESHRHQPLPALILLRRLSEVAAIMNQVPGVEARPLSIVVPFAGALFPVGDFDHLSELDRQRLVTFLNWLDDPAFARSMNFLVLISDTKSEINPRILGLPATRHIEIELPDAAERAHFVNCTKVRPVRQQKRHVKFAMGQDGFVSDTAGLTLRGVGALLESAARTRQPITRHAVLQSVNEVLEAELGDIIRVNMPAHGPDDIVGYTVTRDIFHKIFRRCEERETAIPAVLVSGPNGGGKTFQLEAFAAASGRIVIELTGLRGMYFGQTDKFFELLRWHIRIYGKILIMVDEAHTAFGSVHRGDIHQTEQRLAGNIIKMMGDSRFLGKVVWALMTSRPDELDPDIKSRSPHQVPIFDLEGDERQRFVAEMFRRQGISLSNGDLMQVLEQTAHYSARDYNFLVREVRAAGEPVQVVLQNWRASTAIVQQRRLQTLIAAQHCTYPQLLPTDVAGMSMGAIRQEVETLNRAL